MDFGFLTDKEIKERGRELLGEYFDAEQAVGASYDLSLGEEVYISGQDYPQKLSKSKPFVSLPRGQFALLMTKEYVTVPPDHLGFISIRFGIKAQGLINVSGFHVDPGFEGNIVFSVFNAGPSDVVLKYGEPVFMIFFYKLQHDVDKGYEGESLHQKYLPTKLVTSVKGVSASLSDVDRRVGSLEVWNKVYGVVFGAVVTALVVLSVTGRLGG